MIEMSTSIKAISAALLKFQGLVSGVKRDGANPHFRSRYATLENVIDTAKPALQEAGLMFSQSPGAIVDGSLELTTLLVHADSGEWMRGTMQMPLAKRDPQGTGSAQTYSMRYSLMAMLGLPPTDDDGEAAMARDEPPKRVVGINPQTGMATAHALKKDKGPDRWEEFERELLECNSVPALNKLALAWSAVSEQKKWNPTWHALAKEELNKRREVILNGLTDDDVFPGDRPSSNGKFTSNLQAG